MDRRSFLRATALAGLASSAPWVFTRALSRSTAQEATFGGPYWVFVEAAGGWDPQFLFDPTDNIEHNRMYTGMGRVGNIPFAPIGLDWERLAWPADTGIADYVLTNEQFLMRHGARMTVVNGVDTTTNNHDGGARAMASGQLGVGYPALGALIAAAKAPTMPMAFFSGGGYDFTGGHIPLTRVSNARSFARIARPNEINAGDDAPDLYHTRATMRRIAQFQRDRVEALRDRQHLPTLRRSMQELLDARASTAVLEQIQMPETEVDIGPGELGAQERFMRQAQILISAFKSGLSATGSIRMGGFDTHGTHDRNQTRMLLQLLGGIDYLIAEAGREGLGDQLYVVVTSDFGRGPHYNGAGDNDGKDHWPISSMFALGPGIPGDRVVGATDEAQLALRVDPDSLDLDNKGVKIGPSDIHRALRKLAGLGDEAYDQLYPLAGVDMRLFG